MKPLTRTLAPERPRTLSAQHRSLAESARGDVYERGLSTDVDSLGMHFLIEATEQQNLEAREAAANDAMAITEGAPSDEYLADATFDPTRDIWEQTVALASEPALREGPSMTGAVDDDPLDALADHEENEDDERAVVLTDDVVREASLFDEVDERSGDTRAPRLDTDDVGRHARLRRAR